MTQHEKEKLRNRISAMNTRMRKKAEAIFLNNEVRDKDDKFKALVSAILHTVD